MGEEPYFNLPLPTINPKKTFGSKIKESAKKGYGYVVKKEQEFVQQRQQQRERLNILNDNQLEELAVRNPSGVFGGNMYEKELIRRQRKRVEIRNKIGTTIKVARKETKQTKQTNKSSGLNIDLGFLNPFATFSNKKK